jgi:hypothetical protein
VSAYLIVAARGLRLALVHCGGRAAAPATVSAESAGD